MSDDSELPALPDPDRELMSQVAAGSETAFVELVHRHQNQLLNFFVRMGVYNDGEDLVQETFVRLYRSRERYEARARFTTYLYVLARHVWADRGRKLARGERLQSSLKTDAEIRDRTRPIRPASGLDVQEALARLSPKLREVVVLNVYQGLRYQDIAEVLKIPLGTVKSRLNLALTALRETLDAK
jgi:RNA polymerase sigma-70 factor (ECF subfamily)